MKIGKAVGFRELKQLNHDLSLYTKNNQRYVNKDGYLYLVPRQKHVGLYSTDPYNREK